MSQDIDLSTQMHIWAGTWNTSSSLKNAKIYYDTNLMAKHLFKTTKNRKVERSHSIKQV
jgi:hypothetical protein